MGMMKRMKDMRDMVNAAPDMVAQAQQMGAQAQQMAAAQQAAAMAQMQAHQQQAGGGFAQPGAAPTGPDFEPIASVSLEQFAAISKGVAAYNYDQTKLVEVAAQHGVGAEDWDTASRGWNDRIKANPAVAQRFNLLYRAA
jgi:hypothetical protein